MSQENSFLDFLPDFLPIEYLSTPGAFSRNSKLSVKETISFICTLVSGGLNGGIRQHLSNFLINNSNVKTLDISNACRTRYKIKSSAFEQMFKEVVNFLYQNWDSAKYQFVNRNVFAVDGSKVTLPSSENLKISFDEKSMNFENGSHYFPQCMVTTFYDVFRKIPVKRTVQPYASNERTEFIDNLDELPENAILVVDRGYWGYEVFYHIIEKSTHDIVARMPSISCFKEVDEFSLSDKNEDIVTINPPASFLQKFNNGESKIETPTPITLRLIRYTPVNGTEEIILATTLLDSEKYSSKGIADLYWDRWQVELFYRDEKTYVETAKFHSKKKQGILQELFASVLMFAVTRYHIYKEEKKEKRIKSNGVPQFFSAITNFTQNLLKFSTLPKDEANLHYKRVILILCGVGRYRKQEKRKSKPRVTKSAPNKWIKGRQGRMKKLE
jgi:hypothetical protein